MTRLSMLPKDQFAEDFKQLRRNIEEIKNAQRIGRDIMKPKIIECLDGSGNPTVYDLVTTAGEFDSRTDFTAIFKAESQREPWATIFVQTFYGNPTTPAEGDQSNGFSFISQSKTEEGLIAYRGSVHGAFEDFTPVYVKFFMFATDRGILEVLSEYYS